MAHIPIIFIICIHVIQTKTIGCFDQTWARLLCSHQTNCTVDRKCSRVHFKQTKYWICENAPRTVFIHSGYSLYMICNALCAAPLDPRCSLVLSQGTCRDYIIRWYYDKQANSCAQFWYGGCGGNENRFDTENECKKTCVLTSIGILHKSNT